MEDSESGHENRIYIKFICSEIQEVDLGRRFGSWEQADYPAMVIWQHKEVDEFGKEKVLVTDLADLFSAKLGD